MYLAYRGWSERGSTTSRTLFRTSFSFIRASRPLTWNRPSMAGTPFTPFGASGSGSTPYPSSSSSLNTAP